MKHLWVAALLIIIVLIVVFWYWQVGHVEESIEGLWIADREFCDEAGVDSMLVYFGGPKREPPADIVRDGYIVMGPDVANTGFNVRYSALTGATAATFKFEQLEVWPEEVSIVIDAPRGTMRIHKGPKLYARLFRENILSDCLRRGPSS